MKYEPPPCIPYIKYDQLLSNYVAALLSNVLLAFVASVSANFKFMEFSPTLMQFEHRRAGDMHLYPLCPS